MLISTVIIDYLEYIDPYLINVLSIQIYFIVVDLRFKAYLLTGLRWDFQEIL